MVVFLKGMDDDGRRKRGGFFRRFFNGGNWSLTSSSESRHQSSYSIATVNTPPTERRPIRSVPTVGTQHRVNPDILAKSFVEKEMKYLGTVNDISSDFDPNNRNLLLSLIDEKRRIAQFPTRFSYKNDVLCSFSIHNLKISLRDGEFVIHRIPTHKISSVGFVQDDLYHYVFVQFASEVSEAASCLGVFSADTRTHAEEFCSLTQQMFELVYTETTMDFFDKSIQDGADTPKNHSFSTDDSMGGGGKTATTGGETLSKTLSKRIHLNIQRFLPDWRGSAARESNGTVVDAVGAKGGKDEASTPDEQEEGSNPTAPAPTNGTLPTTIEQQLGSESGPGLVQSPTSTSSSLSSPTASRGNRFKSTDDEGGGDRLGSGSSSSSAPFRLPDPERLRNMKLQEFISLLRECLNHEELAAFAQHLHNFRTGRLTIDQFLREIIRIYTDRRKLLLLGMRTFIPSAKDKIYFDKFLNDHRIVPPSTSTPSSPPPPPSTPLAGLLSTSSSSSASKFTTGGEGECSATSNDAAATSSGSRNSSLTTTTVDDMTEVSEDEGEVTSVTSMTSSSALDESQCLLRSGDADESCCGGGEVSDGDVTVVELSKLKLELGHQRRRKRTSGKRSRDDGRRSPTPEEFGAPFPSFVSYATAGVGSDQALRPADDDDDDDVMTTTGSTGGGARSVRRRMRSGGDSKKRTASTGNGRATAAMTSPTTTENDDEDEVGDDDETSTVSSNPSTVKRRPATLTEHRKKKKKHKQPAAAAASSAAANRNSHVIGIVTEL